MRKIIIHIVISFSWVLLLLMSACEYETLEGGQQSGQKEVPEGEKVQIEIFARANPYQLPSIRANETEVSKTPWVLVFRGQGANATFVEAVQAFEMIGKRYVLLTKQTDGSKYQLLILANPQDTFYYGDASTGYGFQEANFSAKMTQGTTLGEACSNLLTEPLPASPLTVLPYNRNDEVIPMSYLLEVDKIDHTTVIASSGGTPLLLSRVVARMVIANKAPNFELKGITAVINVPRQGQLHNQNGLIMNNMGSLTEYQYDATYSSPLVTAEPMIDGGQTTEGTPVYLYESDTQNDTYLIIQGQYGGKDYYYKMAIVNDVQSLDIIRNHAYTFTIIAAKGPGYDTIEDAKVSKPSNKDFDYTILVDDSDSYEIIANNDYYLGVSNSVFIAYTNVMANYEVFKLTTDCSTDFPNARSITDNELELKEGVFRLKEPADRRIPIVEGGSSNPRITPVIVGISDDLMCYEDHVKDNETGLYRENGYLTLKLGNLEKQIRLRQRPAIPATGKTLQYMPGEDDSESDIMNYYCLSAYVEDGTDLPKNWIKLRPSTGVERDDTDYITVDDGKIYIQIMPNSQSSSRAGVVYLTTIANTTSNPGNNSMKRIKIDITQLGRIINVN